jgi:hypothetical protein
LGVNFAVLGWICMMPFEGGCVFAKENHRGNWQELEVRSIIVLGLQTIFLLQKEQMESERNSAKSEGRTMG